MIFKSKSHAIVSGMVACALGSVAILLGDHHTQWLFKGLVAVGVLLVLFGLFLLRFSWTIRERR